MKVVEELGQADEFHASPLLSLHFRIQDMMVLPYNFRQSVTKQSNINADQHAQGVFS